MDLNCSERILGSDFRSSFQLFRFWVARPFPHMLTPRKVRAAHHHAQPPDTQELFSDLLKTRLLYFAAHLSRLRPFLLSQLERATAHDAGARNDETPRTAPQQRLALARAEMHPVLYPILLLLARLKAGAENVIAEAEQREVCNGIARSKARQTRFKAPSIHRLSSSRVHAVGSSAQSSPYPVPPELFTRIAASRQNNAFVGWSDLARGWF